VYRLNSNMRANSRTIFLKRKYRAITVLILLLVAIAVAVIAFPSAKQQSTQNKSIIYGVSVGDTLPYMNDLAIKHELAGIKSAGFTAVRFDIPWNLVQPVSQSTYNWTKFDTIFSLIKQAELMPLPILDYTPVWARLSACKSSTTCAPAQPGQFATYAAAVVKRYSSQNVKVWEIWNEPNTVAFWTPAPNPAAYTELLKQTYQSIKDVQPSAIVLLGGLSGSTGNEGIYHIDARNFLSDLYADGARNYFDGVAYHPYTNLYLPNDQQPTSGWSKMASLNPSIRSIMIANGDKNKKIWITEMGIPTGGPKAEVTNANHIPSSADHVSEALQAQVAQQVLSDIRQQSWVKSFFWYSYQDIGTSNKSSGDFYGLVKQDGAKKQAFGVFNKALEIGGSN
jgi:hypothetical protein